MTGQRTVRVPRDRRDLARELADLTPVQKTTIAIVDHEDKIMLACVCVSDLIADL